MGILSKVAAELAAKRMTEEALYAYVLREIETGIRRDGLWAKAMATSKTEQEANALYIRFRVQSIKDEQAIATLTESRLSQQSEKSRIMEEQFHAETMKREELEHQDLEKKKAATASERTWLSRPIKERRKYKWVRCAIWLTAGLLSAALLFLGNPQNDWVAFLLLGSIVFPVISVCYAIGALTQ